MIITFLDSGVLIQAAIGKSDLAEKAFSFIDDPEREFASSVMVKLEVMPKAEYHKQLNEVEFYLEYFDSVKHWAESIDGIYEEAYKQASKFGLSGIDSLHVAAALSVGATELITKEKSHKTIHKTPDIKVISLYD